MRGLRKYNVDIACPLEVRMQDSVHSVIKVPGEDSCYHPFHSGVVDNSGGSPPPWPVGGTEPWGACLVGCIGSFQKKVVGVAAKRLQP